MAAHGPVPGHFEPGDAEVGAAKKRDAIHVKFEEKQDRAGSLSGSRQDFF